MMMVLVILVEVTTPLRRNVRIRVRILKVLDDSASDGDITSEGALLVDVSTFNGFSGGLEAQTDVLVISDALGGLGGEDLLGGEGDTTFLLKERSLMKG